MKKLVSLVLALVMLLAVASVAAADENITLKVMMYDRGNTTATYGSPTDNFWTRWMQSEFGDPNGITLEYIPVPRTGDGEKVNTMMAGGTAPDIIFGYGSSTFMDYGKNGGLWRLNDLVDEYGPNLVEHISDTFAYGTFEGDMWCLVAKRSGVGHYCTYIRTDWLDKMGYELAQDENGFYHMSIDDFTELLREAKELDIDATGMEIYPLGVMGAYEATQTRPIVYSFIDTEELTDEIRACYNEMFWPGYKEGVRYLNSLYNEGLIDPDFMVDTNTSYASFTSLLTNNRVLAYGHDANYTAAVETLYQGNPEANIVPLYLENVNGEQFVDVYAPTGMYIAIPKTCEHPEAAVMYLDFIADYENAKVLYYGFEGVHYEMIDGIPVTIAKTEEEKAADTANDYERITIGDMILVYNGQPFGYATSTVGMDSVKARITELKDAGMETGLVGGSAPFHFEFIKTEAQEQYEGFLPGLTSNLPALIACSPEEFDAMYDAVLNDYLAAGGQEVIDQQIELYHKIAG